MLWLLASSPAVKTRMPFCAARWQSRRSSSPPSPRPCIASITETAASAACGPLGVAHVARDAEALAAGGVERADRLVVDVVDLGEERQLAVVSRRLAPMKRR